MPKDVFISHATEDQATAAEVCALLEARGVSCWIAPRDVAPGKVWDEAILDAIESASAFLLILSARANNSSFVKNEVNRAFSQDKPIFALRIEDVQPGRSLELYLARHQWTDGFPPPIDDKVDKLADAIASVVPSTTALVESAVRTPAERARLSLPTFLGRHLLFSLVRERRAHHEAAVVVRFREIQMAVFQVAADGQRPHSVEVDMRPGENEPQVRTCLDDGADRRRSRSSDLRLVLRVHADQYVLTSRIGSVAVPRSSSHGWLST
jgi:TIR domain-containing protein